MLGQLKQKGSLLCRREQGGGQLDFCSPPLGQVMLGVTDVVSLNPVIPGWGAPQHPTPTVSDLKVYRRAI